MIEFFKLRDDPNTIVMREKGARGPTKETRIVVPGNGYSEVTLAGKRYVVTRIRTKLYKARRK